ncbi:MAG: hypothetical protein EOO70_02885, partial [Myxococcaceae bacterium]
MNAMRLILPIGIVFALAAPSPARAQHEGHVMTPTKPAATTTEQKPPPAKPAETPRPPAVDHSTMDHSKMEGMDHSKMESPEVTGMDHSNMEGMDHSKMDHAPSTSVTPIPLVTQADREAAFPAVHTHHEHGTSINSYWLLDRLEVSDADDGTALGWEALAWVGGDIQRVWLRSEGESVDGRI